MNEWDFQASQTFGDPEWEFQQRRIVEIARERGWIAAKPAMSHPVPGPERAPAINVARKKSAVRPKTGKTAI